MELKLPGTSLGDYGEKVYEKYHYTCVYCGFDGRPFDAWMQLSIDHIRPQSCGGTNDLDNLVVACRACNSITSRMKFSDDVSREEIINQKKNRIKERRNEFYEYWLQTTAPRYLDRPLPQVY